MTLAALLAVILTVNLEVKSKPARAEVSNPPGKITHVICVDPGHGGKDPGAIRDALTEASVNLRVALALRPLLQREGYIVFLTRETDTTLSHPDRYNFCNQHNASVMIAIHQNASGDDQSTDSAGALAYKPSDMDLASALANSASFYLNLPVTPVEHYEGGVLMNSKMPATILESLYLSNPTELRALQINDDRVNLEAKAVVAGLDSYFRTHK